MYPTLVRRGSEAGRGGTFQQVVGVAEDPEEKEEEMVLVATTQQGHDLKAVFSLMPDERFIHPLQNGPLPRVASSLQKGYADLGQACSRASFSRRICSGSQGENCFLSNGLRGKNVMMTGTDS